MKKVIWYSIQNCGDGSAYPTWMESEMLCMLDQEFMEEGWGEPCVGSITIESESEIYFKEKIETAETVKEELEKEMRCFGEEDECHKWLEKHLNAVNELIEEKRAKEKKDDST